MTALPQLDGSAIRQAMRDTLTPSDRLPVRWLNV